MNADTDALPAAPAPAMPPPHSVQPAAGMGSEAAPAWKILCVDDEPNIVAALRRLFRGSGYEVSTANSGAHAHAGDERRRVARADSPALAAHHARAAHRLRRHGLHHRRDQ